MSIVLLARDLKLSISTVSRALNGYDDVSEVTRERIFERDRELGVSTESRRASTQVRQESSCRRDSALDRRRQSLRRLGRLEPGGGVELELESGGYSLIATMQTRNDPVRETALYENFVGGGWVEAPAHGAHPRQ